MKHELKAVLERAAKKSGGDRYSIQPEKGGDPWVIYVPQEISRNAKGDIASALVVTIQPEF